MKPNTGAALPAGIVERDLKYPTYTRKNDGNYYDENDDYEQRTFELWLVPSFGWCIPTLQISGVGRRPVGTAPRTYAVTVADGKLVRIGLGPHVTKRVRVHVRKNRKEALQKYLDLKIKGAVEANQVRDRISSRRAQGALWRQNRGW